MNKILGQSSMQQAVRSSFVMTFQMVLSIHVLRKDGREASPEKAACVTAPKYLRSSGKL